MEILSFANFFSICNTNEYRVTGSRQKALLDKFNNSSLTQIGDVITLDDGTSLKVSEIPRINVGMLAVAAAKNNVMDFGSSCYFKFANSAGESQAIFSMLGGALCRPMSECVLGLSKYDEETEKYMDFWNGLREGHALTSAKYSFDDVRNYLNEAGISKGFFSVKMDSKESKFFYSNTEQYPIYRKDDYDLRYYTMTSPDFSYEKSVFKYLEPGTEITIAGEKYTLKDDFTLDIPYGTDIFDIQIPKHTFTRKVPPKIDCTA